MEGGFGFPFGGDPEELMRGLREFAERQAEAVHESQREQFATLTLNTAVELTAAALQQLHMEGSPDVQAATSSISQSSGRPSWSRRGALVAAGAVVVEVVADRAPVAGVPARHF